MAETRLPRTRSATHRRPRLRAGRRLQARHNFIGFHGHGLLALIFFAIIALSVLGVGLGIASLTIFAVGGAPHKAPAAVHHHSPKASASVQALVGHPINGTIVGISADINVIAIQPQGGTPVAALVTTKSVLTRGGVATPLGDLISGDAVVVTFGQNSSGKLVVVTLDDIETVPTNSVHGALTPLPNVTPTPTATPLPTATPGPSASPPIPGP
ncbi:MAG TPA: hypothetical protein VI138_00970 [Candidatus Dormibacteraeota bacterium]